MSQLATSQDWWTKDFLRAASAWASQDFRTGRHPRQEKIERKERDRARIFPWTAIHVEKNWMAGAWASQDFHTGRHPRREKKYNRNEIELGFFPRPRPARSKNWAAGAWTSQDFRAGRRPQGEKKRAKESWPSQDSSLGHHP